MQNVHKLKCMPIFGDDYDGHHICNDFNKIGNNNDLHVYRHIDLW